MFNNKLIFSLLFTITTPPAIFAMEPDGNQQVTISPARLAKLLALQNKANQQLIAAAQEWGAEHLVNKLLALGAEVDTKNVNGETPLLIAALHGHDRICEILINAHAQIDAREKCGITALMYAAISSHESICKLLIASGAQINAKDNGGTSALTYATIRGHASTCKFLIDSGAQIDAKTNGGFSTLQQAVLYGNMTTIRTLISCLIFNPFLSENEFQISRQRIWTALCVFNRCCPTLPKDVRKLILCTESELKNDLYNSAACGVYNNLKVEQTLNLSFPVMRLLAQNHRLPHPEKVVAKIKTRHSESIKPLMLEAMLVAPNDELRAILNPARLEENFGQAIEQIIKTRLGLPLTPNSCSVQ